MHPADAIRGTTSRLLEGRRIVLGVSGSIAAVKSVELARELIRHGADVIPVMTKSAERILHPNALGFACGRAPVTSLTGDVEHVRELGRAPDKADLFLVAPCTGNTLAKMALGIDDSPVTTFASVGLATTPTLVAPAMHDTMYENAIIAARIRELEAAGVRVMQPLFEEGKAKLPDVDLIVEEVLRMLGPGTLRGKRILVVNGSTIEPIDEMRVVTNKSTGRTGAAIALAAWRMGADVEHWFGHGHVESMPRVPTRRFVTVKDLLAMAPDTAGFDAVLLPAAISDFGPAPREGKVSSETNPVLRLEPLPKVVTAIREHFDGVLVPFKAESGIDEKALVERARASIAKNRAAFVVANDLRTVNVDATRVLLVDASDVAPVAGGKDDVAHAILDRLARALDAA